MYRWRSEGHNNFASCLSSSLDGKYLASDSRDTTITIRGRRNGVDTVTHLLNELFILAGGEW